MARFPGTPSARPTDPQRAPGLSLAKIVPNVVTLLGLCAGLTAIRFGLGEQPDFEKAAVALIIAMVVDGVDGRIARLLNVTSRFGAELDSLSDFVCFGVVPAILLYLWTMSNAGGIGWAIVLLFVVCCGLRLARFNTSLMGEEELPPWAYNYFTGVPAPAAAGLAMLPMFLSFATDWEDFFSHPVVAGGVLIAVALLMISRIPTFSFKKTRVPKIAVLPIMVGVGVLVGLLATAPWFTLSIAGFVYLSLIPLSFLSFRRLERRARDHADLLPESAGDGPESGPSGHA
ncbi:phosphatidylcholine/phosphatidylserine synthase [Phaeovibrio sulfidiphilus]|uniref:Phosphatidylcholine/phosphatidylserine synthase n=1 Tax=Phaeovibrio sulfidiphilus TaxID=1220600 RepID=A0A8J7CP51_9PROT|nr:phosphatidylcholine/phosphatidylserine synthase [Phaeovibrio sulfidiphilus]MBE1236632.1 phosphatidylcholine/phosphatidylserine synthase [Phaeovibrio sulfidiphilus]